MPPHRIRDGSSQRNGKAAESAVYRLLRTCGRYVEAKGYYDRYDLLVDGIWRCEVKVAYPNSDVPARWFVNFHRHGLLKEDCDLYIVRIEQLPTFAYALHLLLPAPVGVLTKAYTVRSLIEEAAPLVSNFRLLCEGKWSLKKSKIGT